MTNAAGDRSGVEGVARLVIIAGVGIAVAGVVLLIAAKLGLGRLPGDLVFRGDNHTVFVPLATMLILSIVLTVVLNLFLRR